MLKRSYAEAERACRAALAYRADNRMVRAYLGASMIMQGQITAGLREYDQSVAVETNPLLRALACSARSSIGEQHHARDFLAALKARAAKEFVPAMAFAVLYTALSRLDDAFEAVTQAYENRECVLCHAKHLFIFDSYRDSPGFQQLMRKLFSMSG